MHHITRTKQNLFLYQSHLLQDDFIRRIKSNTLLYCEEKVQHSELTVISGERLQKVQVFCEEMVEKYKHTSSDHDVFIKNMKGKLGEEAVKSHLGDFVTEVDYKTYIGGDGKIDFTLTSDSSVGIQVKTCYETFNNVRWLISKEEIEKNAVLVCVLSQEEFSENETEYYLILAGFIPTNMIEVPDETALIETDETALIKIGIDKLLYISGLKEYLKYPFQDFLRDYLRSDNPFNEEKNQDLNQIINDLIEAEKCTLDVSWILNGTNVCEPLLTQAKNSDVPPEYFMMALLAAFSAALPKKYSFNFNGNSHVIPSIFTVFMGAATAGKSIFTNPFVQPLEKIAVEKNNAFIDAQKRYEEQIEEWKAIAKTQGGKKELEKKYLQQTLKFSNDENLTLSQMRDVCIPEPVEENPGIVSDASFEELKRMSGRHRLAGLLVSPREIKDFLDTIAQISKQNQSALSKLIAVWDGASTLRNRVGGEREKASMFQVSILSTTQTDIFYKYFDVKEDETGAMSRFLTIPITEDIYIPSRLPGDVEPNLLSTTFIELFQKTKNCLALTFTDSLVVQNSQEVLNYWDAWRKKQDANAKQVEGTNKGFYKWLRRNPEYTARIALIIHSLRCVDGVESEFTTMSADSMVRAISISHWLTQKAQIVFNQSLNPKASSTNPEENKIFRDFLGYCKGEPRTTGFFGSGHCFVRRQSVLDIYGRKGQKYLNKPQITKLFKDAEKGGLGKCTTDGKGIVTFTPNPSFNVD